MTRKGYKTVLILFFLFAVGVTGSASAQESSSKPNSTPAKQESAPVAATSDPDYKIGEGVVLDVNVWKEPEISRPVPVRPEGKISLPLVNDIQAAGLTATQLVLVITERLRKFLAEPQVTIIVTAINSQRIYIMGDVGRPGAYPMLPNMTVLQALSSAGSFTQFASLKSIYGLRNENGREHVSGRGVEQLAALDHLIDHHPGRRRLDDVQRDR